MSTRLIEWAGVFLQEGCWEHVVQLLARYALYMISLLRLQVIGTWRLEGKYHVKPSPQVLGIVMGQEKPRSKDFVWQIVVPDL